MQIILLYTGGKILQQKHEALKGPKFIIYFVVLVAERLFYCIIKEHWFLFLF